MPEQVFKPTWEEVQSRISTYITDWAEYLGLSHIWEIQLVFGRNHKELDLEDEDTSAQVKWHNWYKSAKILFNKKRFMNRTRYYCWCQIESTCVHELCHLLESEAMDFIDEEMAGTSAAVLQSYMETLTDRIARLVIRARYNDKICTECNHVQVKG